MLSNRTIWIALIVLSFIPLVGATQDGSTEKENEEFQQYQLAKLESELVQGMVGLFWDIDVREEVGITLDQYRKIKENERSLLEGSILADFHGTTNERTKRLRLATSQANEILKDILIDAQYKRLMQLARQYQVMIHAPSAGLLNAKVAKRFNLSKETIEKLKKIEKKVENNIRKLHARHQQEMEKLLLERDALIKDVLNGNEQKMFDKNYGKPAAVILEKYIAQRLWINREYTRKMIENTQKRFGKPDSPSKQK